MQLSPDSLWSTRGDKPQFTLIARLEKGDYSSLFERCPETFRSHPINRWHNHNLP